MCIYIYICIFIFTHRFDAADKGEDFDKAVGKIKKQ